MIVQKIGRYEIKSELGRGGMATVYLAYDPMFERDVAIKVLPRELLHDPQFRERFEHEGKTIARLEHAAIVPVYDVGDDDGQPFFVMRNMTGGALSDRMKDGPISLEDTARILERLAPALDYAHSKSIIHRDLKPGNILFDEADEPFISDFGIAKLEHSQTNLTGSSIIGTPAYISPEQAQGMEIDGRSDIYSMGVIVYEMLSGKPPYESNTPMGLVFKHVTTPVPHILDVNAALPFAIESVLEKAMAKSPAERFSNASSLAAAITALANGEIPDLKAIIPAATRTKSATSGGILPLSGPILAVSAVKRIPLWVLAGIGVLVACTLLVMGILLIAGVRFATSVKSTPTLAQPTVTVQSAILPVEIPATPTPIIGLGGADKIALITGNNIWVMDVDGANLTRLTTDNQPKFHLRWLPDGSGLVYMQNKCAFSLALDTQKTSKLACLDSNFFEGFSLSPDGKEVAIALDRRLLIVPFDVAALSKAKTRNDLAAMKGCLNYTGGPPAKDALWSQDGTKVALLFLLGNGNNVADTIRVLDVSGCNETPKVLDEFPGTRFTPEGYNDNYILPSYDWDGVDQFLLNTFKRNEGFGELYLYDMSTGIDKEINPIKGSCCYRDARFSPDGKYILFAFQDYRTGADSETLIYYVSLDQAIKNAELQPIKLPSGFFTSTREKPQFALRMAKP